MAREPAFVDIETTYDPTHEVENRMVMIVVKHGRMFKEINYGTKTEMLNEFWEYYSGINNPPLYAHNGIRFDFKYLLSGIPHGPIRQHGAEERPYAWEFMYAGKKNYWYDTVSLIPAKLESIGEAIGYAKGKVDFYKPTDPINVKSQRYQDMLMYCKRDCEILSRYKEFYPGYIELKKTAASTAFNYVFNVPRIKRFAEDAFASVYRGGMTECYYPQGRSITVVDINSSYPNSMLKMPNPYVQPTYSKDVTKGLAGIYYCDIQKSKDFCTPLGVYSLQDRLRPIPRSITGGITKYVNAKDCRMWVSTPELQFLEESGADFTVKYGFEAPLIDITEKITELYKLRKENKLLNHPLKIILNSCYGKFGQRDGQPITIFSRTVPNDLDYCTLISGKDRAASTRYEVAETEGMYTTRFFTTKQCKHRNLLAASYITAMARCNLIRFMKTAGDGQIIYTDTDSLFATDEGLQQLTPFLGNKLGQLKVEETGDTADIYARKCYRVSGLHAHDASDIFKLKGVPTYIGTRVTRTGKYTAEAYAEGWREATPKESMKTGRQNSHLKKLYSMDLRKYRDFGNGSMPYTLEHFDEKGLEFGQTRLFQ